MIKRQKIEPISILVKSQEQIEYAEFKLHELPIDKDKPIEVLIREKPNARGLSQNAYYHMRIGEIAAQAWLNNRQYSHDVWHEYCKKEIMQEEVKTNKGVLTSKWTELPDGSTTVISTTCLEKSCFAEYVTMVEAFGASLGVMFSARETH